MFNIPIPTGPGWLNGLGSRPAL